MSGFAAGESAWVQRLANLRNTVRQELIARQLAQHVIGGMSVLDVGCGQGTQAVRLAARGCQVTGVDPSEGLLARLASNAAAAGVAVEALRGHLDGLPRLVRGRTFDLVCAHGLLMYLDDPDRALGTLADRVGVAGLLSVTFRNREALAFRPGMRRDWNATLDAFNSDSYVNELGVAARAQRLDQVVRSLASCDLQPEAWYGVRVFTDPASPDEPPPDHGLALMLEAEWEAGLRDPYRRLASQIHLIARRPRH